MPCVCSCPPLLCSVGATSGVQVRMPNTHAALLRLAFGASTPHPDEAIRHPLNPFFELLPSSKNGIAASPHGDDT